MEKINYTKQQLVNEDCEFVIEDMKNVFLRGRDSIYNNLIYLGIWKNSNGAGVIAVIENRKIIFDYSRYGLGESSVPIKQFLKQNRDVKTISKDMFFNHLNEIKNILVV